MFKLKDLKSDAIQSAITDITMQKAVDAGSSDICCRAINSSTNPSSQATKKDSNICHRHSNMLAAGKPVVLIDE